MGYIKRWSARGWSVRATAQSIFSRSGALVLAAVLGSCSGGGGGGGGGDGGGTAPLVYAGNTSAAIITTSNAAVLVANIMGDSSTSAAVTGAATGPESSGARQLARRLDAAVGATTLVLRSGARGLASTPVDETHPCDSGSVRFTGDISQSGTGTLNITWSNCRTGDETLNGTATVRVDSFDLPRQAILDGTFTFQRVSLITPTTSGAVSGSIRLQTSFASKSETTTANLITLDSNGKMTMTQNFVVVDVFDNMSSPTAFSETISGRLFDSTHGFVDIVTDSALVFDSLQQRFPRIGQFVLTGASNARIRATAFSSNVVALGLDLKGAGSFERTASLAWVDLARPAGSDLADDDSDGMHNSWETANRLDPKDPLDAGLDADGDRATNLAEYRAGTNPQDARSVPPPPAPRIVNLAGVSDIVYDSGTARIYAAAGGTPGSIVPIDPATGATDAGIAVGIDPIKLVLSDDHQQLYVGLGGEALVQRIALATRTVNQSFALGSDFVGPFYVEDMQIVPGNADALAVSRRYKNSIPRHAGVAIYDSGVPRMATTATHTGSNVIEFGANAGTLYGYNNETTEFGFRTMAVDANGVTITSVFTPFDGDLINGPADIRFAGGRIYTTSGRVIDPGPPSLLGTVALPSTFINFVVPDAALGRAFYLSFDPTAATWTVLAFDTNQLPPVQLGRQDIPGVIGSPAAFIRWGAKGLAFSTSSDQVILIESPNLIP